MSRNYSRNGKARSKGKGKGKGLTAFGWALATIAGLVGVVWLTPTSPVGAAEPVSVSSRPRAGDKAPAFVLKTVDKGEPRALNHLAEESHTQGVVLVFVSCKCPYVAQARQPLAELFERHGTKVTFVGINANQNETLDDVKADAARSFPFPVLRDEGSKVADLYSAERTPEVFLIDAKGVIRYHGGVADLGPALTEFTNGHTPTKAESKAFGCTIKRKV